MQAHSQNLATICPTKLLVWGKWIHVTGLGKKFKFTHFFRLTKLYAKTSKALPI
jgi:hypothetical protein